MQSWAKGWPFFYLQQIRKTAQPLAGQVGKIGQKLREIPKSGQPFAQDCTNFN